MGRRRISKLDDLPGADQKGIRIRDLHVLFDVEKHPGVHVIGDQVLGFDDLRAAGRLFRPHIEDSIDRQKAIIHAFLPDVLHRGEIIGIPGDVDGFPVQGKQISDAFFGIVVGVPGGHGLDFHAEVREGVVNSALQRVFGPNHDRPFAARDQMDRVMVIMLMGDEHQIRGKIIAVSCIGIDVYNLGLVRLDAQGRMPLI